MNPYDNQFNRQPQQQQYPQQQQQPQQQQYGYPVNGQPQQYQKPKAPMDKAKIITIANIAMGGVVALSGLILLVYRISLLFRSLREYYGYKLSMLSEPLLYITLGAALVLLYAEKLIEPFLKGDKTTTRMAMYISVVSVAGLTALLGIVGLFESFGLMIERMRYFTDDVIAFLSIPVGSPVVIAGSGVVILYYVLKLLPVIRLRKSMKPAESDPSLFGVQSQQYAQPKNVQQPYGQQQNMQQQYGQQQYGQQHVQPQMSQDKKND